MKAQQVRLAPLATLVVALTALSLAADFSSAAVRTWIGGDGNWGQPGDINDWNPADEPDSDDDAVFNTDHLVNLEAANSISALTMSGSIELNLNDFDLIVAGSTTLSGAGTRLAVEGADATFTAQNITINNGSTLFLDGGTVNSSIAGAPIPVFTIAGGGTLSGNGNVSIPETIAAATTVINNNGIINASNPVALVITPPTAATLSITSGDPEALLDLDGSLETGAVIVSRNQTLHIDMAIADIFNGVIDMAHNTQLNIVRPWILGANATVEVDNGATGGIGGIPAGTATIAGGSFSQNAGTISVLDLDGTLRFDAPFTMNGGTLTNNGLVIFNQTATLAAAANFAMVGDADLTVEAHRTVTVNQTNFDLDGTGGAAGTVITINNQGRLNLNSTDYDPDTATNRFNGTLNINSGTFNPTTGDAEFVMDGVLNMANSNGGAPIVEGEPIDIGNDSGALNADLNLIGGGNYMIKSQVDFNSDADVNIGAAAALNLEGAVNFDTVNGGNNAEFTGTGSIFFFNTVNVNEAVTLNMMGGSITLDGVDGTGNIINIDAPLTINAQSMSSFGNSNDGGGVNTIDVNNSGGAGVLTVNLDNPAVDWTISGPGVMNLVNDNTAATLLAGNDVDINGTLNVTGDVRTAARLDIAGVVNVNTAAEPLRLAGGNNTNDTNTIAGGAISGAGLLGADDGKASHGFGTINTGIDFDGTSHLKADNGTLTVNGPIVDAGTVGTADSDATLHVTNAWNNNVTTGVQLLGGTLSGGTITNDITAGISGHGLVTVRVINNSQLFASLGESLIFDTPADDNDWDGTTNDGQIEAISANIELRNIGAAFGFTGIVRAGSTYEVFANGFALDFNPGSTLELQQQGKYRSTSSTDLGGNLIVGPGANATIEVENNFFLSFENGSSTSLEGDLTLKNNNIIIEQGAAFSGPGALIVPDGSHLVANNFADIDTFMLLEGGLRPGNSQGIGRVGLFDFQQTETSELFIEITGNALNKYDRLVADGDVIVDGFLSIDIDDISPGVSFVPTLGQTFNIITGHTVTGEFDFYDISGMPVGLSFHINYLPNAVQLEVVDKASFAADFDDDGDVDETDYAIWTHAYELNQLGDATGDNQSTAADYVLWRLELGSTSGSGSGAGAGAAVPEPGTACLLVLAMLAAVCGRGARTLRAV